MVKGKLTAVDVSDTEKGCSVYSALPQDDGCMVNSSTAMEVLEYYY